ncbi:MAG: nitric oxide synthase oxygenase [Alphaproteobacteria bacterium]|nr:nitric oxide synthase oxygenase [Alphaproteobacteria bacterium]
MAGSASSQSAGGEKPSPSASTRSDWVSVTGSVSDGTGPADLQPTRTTRRTERTTPPARQCGPEAPHRQPLPADRDPRRPHLAIWSPRFEHTWSPHMSQIPPDAVMEVEIEHPDLPWFAELGLRWYVLPAVSELVLDSGGVQYRCVPFNGFYMVTEIGARNFSDESRYDLLPVIADKMGLDRRTTATLWKDRALVELNVAVMHSFQKKKVRMQDHHAMSTYFEKFEEQEIACKRPVYADWSWLVPPMSGSTSSIFLRDDLQNVVLKPMYAYQKKAWEEDRDPDHEGPVPPCPYHRRRAHG